MLLTAKNIVKYYKEGSASVQVLKGADFQMPAGELVGIFGASGSGKSTLLHILGGLDYANQGEVHFEGQNLEKMPEPQLAEFRNKKIGFVFQFYYLLPEFSALENVMLPCLIANQNHKQAREKAALALKKVDMDHRLQNRPSELSGGEQQRVALARALVMDPKLILADEPTGNLDRETGQKVLDYLLRLNQEKGMSMIIVSHNADLLKQVPRTVLLQDGKLHDQ
ncbi:MAG: ABC transporter ATP-binding protein [Pseudomonadota bacterium]